MKIFGKDIRLIPGTSRIKLEMKVAELQHSVESLTSILVASRDTASGYSANPYPSYEAKVQAISAKYEGEADWGCELAQTIIAVRAAFTVGNGIKPVLLKQGEVGERTLRFVKALIRHNQLDEEKPIAFAEEAEIEGKALFGLYLNRDAGSVDIRFVPWTQHRYTITAAADDYSRFTKVEYHPNNQSDQDKVELDEKEFAYNIFGGRVFKPNTPTPLISKALWSIESLSKAAWDWRAINRIVGLPTPVFKCETQEAVAVVDAMLDEKSWMIGDTLVTTSDYSVKGVDASKVETLRQEAISLTKRVSGTTSTPVHFLGLPDELSNRSTADSMTDLIDMGMTRPRNVWKGLYVDVIRKAIRMARELSGNRDLDPDAVGIEMPQTSKSKMDEIATVWLPLYELSAITLPTLLSKIPEIDATEEAKNVQSMGLDKAKVILQQLRKEEETAA